MQIVAFVDLDDTFFQTKGKCPAGEAVVPAAYSRQGQPLSFMTGRQERLLALLQTNAIVIPATARNLDAYRRVDLRFTHEAILNFGGVILQPDGQLDREWDDIIRPAVLAAGAELQDAFAGIQQFITQHRLDAYARLIDDFDLPLYVVIKHPQANLDSLQQIQNGAKPFQDGEQFFIHRNGNNLSLVPRCLGKGKAVQYLIEKQYDSAPVLTIGVGDSLSDVSFLKCCDYMLIPQNSQISSTLD